jgi:hypothetical protein
MVENVRLGRRTALRWLSASTVLGATASVATCQTAPRIYDMQVSRDTGCPCCHVWTKLMQATGRFRLTMVDAPDLPAFKRSLGVPPGLGSCHTAVVETLVVEGHVPAEAILRLLDQRPAGVRGIAVPGMPRGSPGMEQPNGAVDPYEVIAFGVDGSQSVFSLYAGNQ